MITTTSMSTTPSKRSDLKIESYLSPLKFKQVRFTILNFLGRPASLFAPDNLEPLEVVSLLAAWF